MRTRIAWHRDKTFCVQVRDPFVLKFRDYLVSETEATTSRLADAELVPDADAATRACFLACWQYDHILDGDSDARKLYAARSTTPSGVTSNDSDLPRGAAQ